MKPFLLLATRAEDAPAEAEYDAFRRFGMLEPDQLIRHRLEAQPLGQIDLDSLSGIILGGSPFTVSDPEEGKGPTQRRVEAELSELLDEVITRDMPFLGACYGIGIIGRHQGAVVDRTFGEPVGPTLLTLTPAGRRDPLLSGLPASFEAFVGHKEAISRLPEGVEALAGSARCPVQAFRIGDNVYATQFHPELDVEGLVTRIEAYRDFGYFAPDEVEALSAAARASRVSHPSALIRRFVERYARD